MVIRIGAEPAIPAGAEGSAMRHWKCSVVLERGTGSVEVSASFPEGGIAKTGTKDGTIGAICSAQLEVSGRVAAPSPSKRTAGAPITDADSSSVTLPPAAGHPYPASVGGVATPAQGRP